MKNNFISKHVINQIMKKLYLIKKEYGFNGGFIWFDSSVSYRTKYFDSTKVIDRINIPANEFTECKAFLKDDYIAVIWDSLSGDVLWEIYKKISNFEFFVKRKYGSEWVASKIKKEYQSRNGK
jgi:hypothetical protein